MPTSIASIICENLFGYERLPIAVMTCGLAEFSFAGGRAHADFRCGRWCQWLGVTIVAVAHELKHVAGCVIALSYLPATARLSLGTGPQRSHRAEAHCAHSAERRFRASRRPRR